MNLVKGKIDQEGDTDMAEESKQVANPEHRANNQCDEEHDTKTKTGGAQTASALDIVDLEDEDGDPLQDDAGGSTQAREGSI